MKSMKVQITDTLTIDQIIKTVPLTPDGFGTPDGLGGRVVWEPWSVYKREIDLCKKWLKWNAARTKRETKISSYLLKHIIEKEEGCYISNGSLIRAAIECGYTAFYDEGLHSINREGGSHNCSFNMLIGVKYGGRLLDSHGKPIYLV